MIFTEDFLFKITLVFFISLTIIVICFATIGYRAYSKSTSTNLAKEFNEALYRLHVLRIVMAVIMVFAATMLATIKIISGDAVVSIISGIVGYVLGALAEPAIKNKTRNKETRENVSELSQDEVSPLSQQLPTNLNNQ